VAILLPSLGLLPSGDASTGAELIRILMIALGIGFALLVMTYAIGPISGCHINPAVTLALFLAGKLGLMRAVYEWIGQIVGGVAGAAIIYGIASGRDGFQRGQFDANLWTGRYFGLGSTIVTEVVLTALLVMVVLFATTKRFTIGFGGLATGITLTLIYMISIPVDNGSVNPARSIGTAVFADGHTHAMQQLWAFIVLPLIGSVVGLLVWLMLDDTRFEETELRRLPGSTELREVLNSISDVVDVSDND
jgi:aquaporin Z